MFVVIYQPDAAYCQFAHFCRDIFSSAALVSSWHICKRVSLSQNLCDAAKLFGFHAVLAGFAPQRAEAEREARVPLCQ